jgi:chromosome segregation ATPase
LGTPNFSAPPPPSAGDHGWNLKTAILFGAVIALLFATIYLFIELDRTQSDFVKFRDTTLSEIARLRESTSVTTANSQKSLKTMREELEAAQRQASIAVGQAKTEAVEKARQLSAAVAEEQRRQNAKLTGDISEVKQATTEASTKIGQVSTDVTGVKSDVAATKEELAKTVAELKRVNGDMGVMSGLVATNGKELDALKQLGDRNYFEFNLGKTKAPQKVGDIAVQLKSTDPKKNRFTIEVIADDKKVEKKDKNVNEPVQFYVAKARQPYELVVNEVKKNQIVGYLATPKVQQSR